MKFPWGLHSSLVRVLIQSQAEVEFAFSKPSKCAFGWASMLLFSKGVGDSRCKILAVLAHLSMAYTSLPSFELSSFAPSR